MIHLHGHSHFSLFEGFGSPKKIIEKAKQLGFSSIALTDYQNMYGSLEFYENAIKNEIKPIIGVEIAFSENPKEEKIKYITLLSKNYNGYKNLLRIVTESNLKNYINFPKINFEILKNYGKDIFIILGGRKNIIGKMILSNENPEKIIEFIKKFENIIGKENIIFELQPQPGKKYKKINKTILEINKKLNYILTINNNFHFINKEDKEIFGLINALKSNEFYNPKKHIPEEIWHILSKEEMINYSKKYLPLTEKDITKILTNNEKIANQINIEIPLGKILFPKYEPSENIKKLYEKFQKLNT